MRVTLAQPRSRDLHEAALLAKFSHSVRTRVAHGSS